MSDDADHQNEVGKKVSIRYSKNTDMRIRQLLREHPDMLQSQVLRHLLDAALALAETKGFGEVLRLKEDPAHYDATKAPNRRPKAPEQHPIALYRSLVKGSKPVENILLKGHAMAKRCVALAVPDDAMTAAGLAAGAMVIVDPDGKAKKGATVALERGGRTVLRRLVQEGAAYKIRTETDEYEETGVFKQEMLLGTVVARVVDGAAEMIE